jgi:hypothetical protein
MMAEMTEVAEMTTDIFGDQELVLEAQPTAWESVPGFVRFATWLAATLFVLSVAFAVLIGVYLGVKLGTADPAVIPPELIDPTFGVPTDLPSVPADGEGFS